MKKLFTHTHMLINRIIAFLLIFTIFPFQILCISVNSATTTFGNDIISERLDKALSSAKDDDIFYVMLWFFNNSKKEIQSRISEEIGKSELEWKMSLSEKTTLDEIHDFKKSKARIASEIYKRNNDKIAESELKGEEIDYISRYSPVILAHLSKNKIQSIAKSECIESIDLYFGDKVTLCASPSDEMIASHTTLAKNSYGYNGTGVKIGIVDVSVPNLTSVIGTHLPSGCTYYVDPNSNNISYGSSHATYCGNIIANVANGAEIYFTQRADTLIAIEWLVDQGVDVISMSMSIGAGDKTNSYTAYSRWYDHISYQHYISMCLAAGNTGNATALPTSGIGASTGIHEAQMAYNVITVASMDFKNTT